MSLRSILEEMISERRFHKGTCDAIVIHPNDFDFLLHDLGLINDKVKAPIHFMDANIYRSEDIKEGEFKVF